MAEITCTRLEQFMDECQVRQKVPVSATDFRAENRRSAADGDCPFADRCNDHLKCPLSEQKNTLRPGINPVFLKPGFDPSFREYYTKSSPLTVNVDVVK